VLALAAGALLLAGLMAGTRVSQAAAAQTASISQPGGADRGHDDDPGDEDEWEGQVQTLPATGLRGRWTILSEAAATLVITVDAVTRIDARDAALLAAGVWVEVDGVLQPDGAVLATRLRVDDYEDGEIIVRLENSATLPALLDDYDLELRSEPLKSAHIYRLGTSDDEPDLVEKVAQEPGVIWAELNYVQSVPEGEGYKTWKWGGPGAPAGYTARDVYAQVGLPRVAGHFDGSGTVVAVLDTGVYSSHPLFAGRLRLPGLDVIDDDLLPDDAGPGQAWGHGTHVAGIIAVLAPGATILPVRVLDSGGRGNTFLLAYAVEWAVAHGANVVNLSLGTDFDSRILHDVTERAGDAGVVVVAAAGNQGQAVRQYPAAYERVLAATSASYISATQSFSRSAFANYGAEWVDLAAPGEGVLSAMVTVTGTGYARWSGTSMSAALVSGAAALAWQKLEASAGRVEGQAVAALLVEQAAPLVGETPWVKGGLLDLDRALMTDEPESDVPRVLLPMLAR
jgi:subtilisin family serine protease